MEGLFTRWCILWSLGHTRRLRRLLVCWPGGGGGAGARASVSAATKGSAPLSLETTKKNSVVMICFGADTLKWLHLLRRKHHKRRRWRRRSFTSRRVDVASLNCISFLYWLHAVWFIRVFSKKPVLETLKFFSKIQYSIPLENPYSVLLIYW